MIVKPCMIKNEKLRRKNMTFAIKHRIPRPHDDIFNPIFLLHLNLIYETDFTFHPNQKFLITRIDNIDSI